MAIAGWKGLVWSGDWVANINAQLKEHNKHTSMSFHREKNTQEKSKVF